MDYTTTKTDDLPAPVVAGMALPSVGSLFLRMRFDGQMLASGTGFVMQSPSGRFFLITNRHNVTGRRQDDGSCLNIMGAVPNEVVVHHHIAGYGNWVERVETLYEGETPRWIEHPRLGARADFVALPLANLGGTSTLSWKFDAGEYEQTFGPADPVSVVGFPFGISYGGYLPVWATGFVASEPSVDYLDLPVFLIDSRTREGQSGSPVVKQSTGGTIRLKNGKSMLGVGPMTTFLGIYSGRIHAQSDIGMVWKKDAIKELIDTL